MRSLIIRFFIVLGLLIPALATAASSGGVLYACNVSSYYFCQDYYVGTANCGTSATMQTITSCSSSNVTGTCTSSGFFSTYFYPGYPLSVAKQVCASQPYGVWSDSYVSQSSGNASQTTYALTVTRSGSGSGAVTSSPAGIDCGATCSASLSGSATLTATPASGSTFAGWSGDCTGTGSCVVAMSAAKSVTATFKQAPFAAATTTSITATSATIATHITFNAPDVGKTGAVFITAWVPVNGLGTFGILTAHLNQTMSVTATNDNPYPGGEVNSRQETLGALLAATDPTTSVLVQLTPSGWQLVQNGQLAPYTTGVLGDSLASMNILNNTNPANLLGSQFCVGYGTSAAEMIAAGRMQPVAIIPDATGNAAANGSCNVANVVVEFYNTNLDNYFITADAGEAAQVDNGMAGPGWSRTGNTFKSGGTTSVCRFYGSYSPGPTRIFIRSIRRNARG